jgi:hypothetical protein
MDEAERIAVDMIRRYGSREAAIQQAHACDVEAWRRSLVSAKSNATLYRAIQRQGAR